ncbi:MAG: aminoacyl-tRNA hydrolase [Methylobacter sp.]
MIKLIVGLGNPGLQYEKTRHNAGFLFLDRLVSDSGCNWVKESKFDGLLSKIDVAGDKVLLLKPNTFMNRSGQAVGKVVRYYKLVPDEILVIHDELDFDVGVIKLKKGGGHAGHNGLRDIISHLGAKEFYRLRIGIGRPSVEKNVSDFVLSSPSKSEWDLIWAAFDFAVGYVRQMVVGDMSSVMNKLNSR